MKSQSVYHGIVFALVLALISVPLYHFIYIPFSFEFATKGLFTFIFTTYTAYLLNYSPSKTGRVAVGLMAGAAILGGLFLPFSVFSYIVGLAALAWVLRSLYYQNSFLGSAADLGLVVGGFLLSWWTWTLTGSVFATVWTYFLIQALFVLIPEKLSGQKTQTTQAHSKNKFYRASKTAEEALRRLATNNS